MKKILSLMTAFILALSLTACNNQKTTDISNPVGGGSSSESDNNQPVIDTKWASNDFEMQIPQPFFNVVETKWTAENAVYMMSGEKHTENTSVEALNAYIDELRTCGFNALESEYNFLGEGSMYAFCAWNSLTGYGIYVQYDEITQEEISQLPKGMTPGPAVFVSVFDCHQEITSTSLPEVAYATYLDAKTEMAKSN